MTEKQSHTRHTFHRRTVVGSGLLAVAVTLMGGKAPAGEVLMANAQHPTLDSSFTLDFGIYGGPRSANISITDFDLEVDPSAGTARFVNYYQEIEPLELPGGISTGDITVTITQSLGGSFDRATGEFVTTDDYAVSFTADLSVYGLTSPVILRSTSAGTVRFDTVSLGVTRMAWEGGGALDNPVTGERESIPFNYTCTVNGAFSSENQTAWITTSYPPHGAVDARQPMTPAGEEEPTWTNIDIAFVAPPLQALSIDDFDVLVRSPAGDVTIDPGLVTVAAVDDQTVTLSLDSAVEPKSWLLFTHRASGTTACLGVLPGDVNGDGTANPALDLSALIDCINRGTCESWRADINRNGGSANVLDLARLIDLFNGAGLYEPWTGARIGASPCATR